MADLVFAVLIGLVAAVGVLNAVVWSLVVIDLLKRPYPYIALFAPECLPLPRDDHNG